MAKPSIFSENYGGNMKKRRRKKIIISLVILIAICGALFLLFNEENIVNIRTGIKNLAIFKEKDNSKVQNNESNTGEKNIEKNDEKKVELDEEVNNEKNGNNVKEDGKKDEEIKKDKIEDKKENTELKSEYIGLGREMMITLNYKMLNGKKEFISIEQDEGIETDILGNFAVVNIKKSQNTYLIREDFVAEDITKLHYISSKKKKFEKAYVMSIDESYVWCKSPKFIDENTILYISSLPWINSKKDLYLWIYKVNEGKYIQVNNRNSIKLKGKEILVGERGDNLIKIQIDGKEYKVDSNGVIKK